jgi:hypothetical protein
MLMMQFMECNPRWENETFVLRMDSAFYRALSLVLYSPDSEMRQRVLDKYRRKVSSSTRLVMPCLYFCIAHCECVVSVCACIRDYIGVSQPHLASKLPTL